MSIRVDLSILLRSYASDYDSETGITVAYEDGKTVAHIITELGIPSKQVFAVLVNRRPSRVNYRLQDGDHVTLARLMGAG